MSLGPALCPVCGSVGARALMLDHIEAEHPNLKQDSEELREIESCVVAPDERQPGRAYERVQEILLELYGLRQRLGLNGSDEPTS